MKRFLVPAFFVIHAENKNDAEQQAAEGKNKANDFFWFGETSKNRNDPKYSNFLFLDEELPTREVQIVTGETELPHSYPES